LIGLSETFQDWACQFEKEPTTWLSSDTSPQDYNIKLW